MGISASNRLTSIVGGQATGGPGQSTAAGGTPNVAGLPGLQLDTGGNVSYGGHLNVQMAGFWLLVIGVAAWAYVRWVK